MVQQQTLIFENSTLAATAANSTEVNNRERNHTDKNKALLILPKTKPSLVIFFTIYNYTKPLHVGNFRDANKIPLMKNLSHADVVFTIINIFKKQSFTRRGSAQRSNLLPSYKPFLTE